MLYGEKYRYFVYKIKYLCVLHQEKDVNFYFFEKIMIAGKTEGDMVRQSF